MHDEKHKKIMIIIYSVLIVTLAIIGCCAGGLKGKPTEPRITLHEIDKTDSGRTVSSDLLIDINNADAIELEELKGIGPGKAAAIVKMREEMYGFQTVNDLLCVDGIGIKTLEEIRPYLKVDTYKVKNNK